MVKKISLGFHPTIYPDPDTSHSSSKDKKVYATHKEKLGVLQGLILLIEEFDLVQYKIARQACVATNLFERLQGPEAAILADDLVALADVFGLTSQELMMLNKAVIKQKHTVIKKGIHKYDLKRK